MTDVAGFIGGLVAVVAGVAWIYPPAGLIVGGLFAAALFGNAIRRA